MLRYKADIQTLIYMVGLSILTIFLFMSGSVFDSLLTTFLWLFQLIAFISVGVIVHNHKHVTIWRSRSLNLVTDSWLSLLFGFPVFGWIPVHIQNHHTHTNKEEDFLRTYAYSENNNLLTKKGLKSRNKN